MEIDELRVAGLLDELQSAVREPRCLIRVDREMSRIFVADGMQALAYEVGFDAIAEADLDRARRLLALDPRAQCLALFGWDGHRKEAVGAAVRAGDRRPLPK